jgi:hypothetical protein
VAYYDNPGQVNDEAISIAGGKTFQVIQVADLAGNVSDAVPNLLAPLISGFTFPAHDQITVSRTGGRVTSIVHLSSTVAVSTLTISYDSNGNLTGITQAL